ncbi:MAG: 30S ribosomal protein S16 [Candidatus Nealsonbacteria bacterium CG_4_9_14_3_um_filter_35_11]|nr:MAG: 30S ribosomal protein S16 [Candidatus Nealsonbacteria bacterium CG_4_10_14_0_2_um_filter_35_20]PJA84876.1 MAG: 30S ribosomal protein S16 [Candidatus Nealsonbacteria bacterium CG_4_9_14_3_um_filter_35_11]
MLVIRLFRVGKKKQPSFKIVVCDKRNPSKRGNFVEEVGFYNPLTKEKVLRKERIEHWLKFGAQPSDSVYNLLIQEKILSGKKRPVYIKQKPKQEAEKEVKKEVKKERIVDT